VLNASWPLSRTAGEGGERSETGEGFAAFQIFSRHSARGALVVSPVVREALRRQKSVAPRPHWHCGRASGEPGQSTTPWKPAFAGMTIMPGLRTLISQTGCYLIAVALPAMVVPAAE
jgi:hypothetical protein